MNIEQNIEEITKRLNHLSETVAKATSDIGWIKWLLLAIFAERVVDKLF